jgi:hypothetical protein
VTGARTAYIIGASIGGLLAAAAVNPFVRLLTVASHSWSAGTDLGTGDVKAEDLAPREPEALVNTTRQPALAAFSGNTGRGIAHIFPPPAEQTLRRVPGTPPRFVH